MYNNKLNSSSGNKRCKKYNLNKIKIYRKITQPKADWKELRDEATEHLKTQQYKKAFHQINYVRKYFETCLLFPLI